MAGTARGASNWAGTVTRAGAPKKATTLVSRRGRAVGRASLAGLRLLHALAIGAFAYDRATAMSYDRLAATLRADGAAVSPGDAAPSALPSAFFWGSGRSLTLNGEQVDVYEYAATPLAALDALRASDGKRIAAALIGPAPQAVYFDSGRVLVVYPGGDPRLARLLGRALGAPFACLRAADGRCLVLSAAG